MMSVILGACSSQTPGIVSLSDDSPVELFQDVSTKTSAQFLPIVDVEIRESDSVPGNYEAVVSGQLTSCGYSLLDPKLYGTNRVVIIILQMARYPNQRCQPTFYPIETVIPLGQLDRGPYRIRVNDQVETVWIP